jgi:hypothetical protein
VKAVGKAFVKALAKGSKAAPKKVAAVVAVSSRGSKSAPPKKVGKPALKKVDPKAGKKR